MDKSIYKTYIFRDKNTNQLIRQLTVVGNSDHTEKIKKTLMELGEHYSLAESEIIIEN